MEGFLSSRSLFLVDGILYPVTSPDIFLHRFTQFALVTKYRNGEVSVSANREQIHFNERSQNQKTKQKQ